MNKYRTHHEAFWGLVAQGIGFVTGLLIVLVSLEKAEAFSFGLGFLACLLPNFVFYTVHFRYQGAQHLITIKNRFYLGEMAKLLLTVGMFALVWQIAWIRPVWVFCGYGVSLFCFFLPPIGINVIQTSKMDSKRDNKVL